MRQIGARQEAGKVGGIGSCGRELCCATWLTDFKSVNTNAARYQNLSINQTKLSGQCGRLKCCLNYELDTYLDALQFFPTDADMLETGKGRAFLIKKDIFKNLMWYTMADSTKHYPLTIEMVKKIKLQNREGIKPEVLETAEVVTGKPKEVEPEYADIVGQISLKTLEKTTRKRRDKERGQEQRDQQRPQGPANRGPQGPGRGQRSQPNQGPQSQQGPRQPQVRGEQKPPANRNQRPPQQGQIPNRGGQRPPQQNQNRPPRPPQNRGPRNSGEQDQSPPAEPGQNN